MKRFYMTTLDTFHGSSSVGSQSFRHIDLFHPRIGAHYVDLVEYTDPASALLKVTNYDAWKKLPEVVQWLDEGGSILLAGDFNSEFCQAVWHDHPKVSRMQDPVAEASVTVQQLHSRSEYSLKRFKKEHADRLAVIGIKASDNVFGVHQAAKARHPLVCLSNTY